MPIVKRSKHHAFSLLELIIVIIIMGLVYSVVDFNFAGSKKKLPVLSLETLPSTMRDTFKGEPRRFIIYGDECDKAIFIPELEDNQIEKMTFSPDIKVYTFDAYGALRLKEFASIKSGNDDLPVCFSYDIFSNQSTSHMVVKNGSRFYYMPALFGEVQYFNSMAEAQSAMLHADINPHELYLEEKR